MSESFGKLFFGWVLVLAVLWSFIFYWPKQSYLIACDVGQGDAILMTSGFTQVLIDGGPNDKVLECLSDNMPFWDRQIEVMVNTHPDSDHFTGLKSVVERYIVKQFVSNNLANSSKSFQEFRQLVLDKEIPVYMPKMGDEIKMGDFVFKVLWPEDQAKEFLVWRKDNSDILGAILEKERGFNNQSIVLLFQSGDFKALLTGDIDKQIEEKIAAQNEINKLDVLKIAHHGSKYSTSEDFIKITQPKTAIISVGKNPWGHPTKEVLDILEKYNVHIFRTDEQKDIKIRIK